ncbi:MAG: adenylate/guanylate cyclase domain-containing protein [Candidatus Eremiobacteraeota bacterium]|nr:adenylate/guanylate cyclase domain-containing protein [Candidatus Eremiobacteraeota bacterium]
MAENSAPPGNTHEKRMAAITDISRTINSLLDIDRILEITMDSVISLFNAERGFIMLFEEDTGDLVFRIARGMDQQNLNSPEFEISRSVVLEVARTKTPLLCYNAADDVRFKDSPSIQKFSLRAIICVPMMIKERLVGVIYIDNRLRFGAFAKEDLDFAVIFSHQAATAIENAILASDTKRLRRLFESRVSPRVVEELLSRSGDAGLLGEKRIVSVMFLDIRGFTSLSESFDPQHLVAHLNDFWEEIGEIIFREEGTLITYLGDAMMSVFGAPISRPDDALRAVRASLTIHGRMAELRQKWAAEGKPVFDIGIGVNTGEALVGDVGFSKHREYSVIGDTTNTAARLEKLNKDYSTKLIISESTYQKVAVHVVARYLGEALLKGKSQPVKVYEVAGMKR